jgi:septal ring factor EnvC (AmiA/AmiB activator)
MTENTVQILIWMLLAAAFVFMIGWTCGEQVCRRKNAEEKVAELYQQLEHSRSGTPEQQRQFKELRSVINDVHKHIVAVSKALKIAGR